MVLLNPVPFNISNKIINTKKTFNLPDDSFLYMYKVDYSEKIVSFMENRNINGLIITVWKNENYYNPWEQLVVIKLYHKPNVYLNSSELLLNIQIQQLDKDNYEIKSALSTNIYIYNLNIFSLKEYEVKKGRIYCLKKQSNTELAYYIANYD